MPVESFKGKHGHFLEENATAKCDASTAMERAEQLRQVTAEMPVQTAKGLLSVTMSLGVLPIDPQDTWSFDQVLHDVDQALYAAKAAGRNCCVAASRGLEPVEDC